MQKFSNIIVVLYINSKFVNWKGFLFFMIFGNIQIRNKYVIINVIGENMDGINNYFVVFVF